MSKIVWTPEHGWTDNGPECKVVVDERGRIRALIAEAREAGDMIAVVRLTASLRSVKS